MKIKKIIIINTSIFLGTIVLVTGCNKNNDIIDDNINYSKTSSIEEVKDNIEINNDKVINSQNNNQNNQTLQNDDTDNNIDTKENVIDNQYTDNDKIVIETFNDINQEVDVILQNDEDESIKDKAKGTFITIVDFIFYDAEIKGIKFDDLTDGAKEEVLTLAHLIDSKIENRFPAYKDAISDKTKGAYNKASEIIKKGANNVKDFSKEKLGEENYNAIIDAKDELVYYTKNALSIVGDVTSNLWESGKTKIKNWYENFKNNQ